MTAPTPVPSPEEEGDSPLVPRIGSGDSIAMVEITSHKDLEIWLEGKPVEFAQVIAARAALRALPYSLLRKELIDVKINHANIVFRDAIGVVTKFINIVHNEEAHQSVARKFLVNAAHELHDIPVGTTFRPEVAALTSLRAVNAAIQLPAAVVRDYTAMVYSACVAFDDQTDAWRAVSADAEWLNNRATRSATHRFDTSELWHGEQPSNLALMMSSIQNRLLALDPTYQVWIDWYNRRIKGEDAAFDIPGDINRTEDKGILIKLADATDEEFWGKGAEYVNSTLQSWIDEARTRVRPPKPDPLTDIVPDPQDRRSPAFDRDTSGRIAISIHAGAEMLRTDPQAQVRHDLARRMAQALGDALRGHNNAGYITGMAEAYLDAMGDRAEAADPSTLVFAGDQLREAIAKHRRAKPDDDLQPLPSAADRDAGAFLSAHNMYVGSDTYLDDLDRTTRGPDAPLPSATPAEITQIAVMAHNDDILAETSYDYIVAAAAVAPANYNSADRHSRFTAGLGQNFGRYGIELLSTYPDEAAWAAVAAGVGAVAVLGPVAAIGAIPVAYYIARNIIANEAVYRKLLSTSPAGEHNFKRMMRFLKSLPYKSLKDD